MERQTIAYLIIFALAAVLGGWLAFRWYHGRDRTYRRRKAREQLAYEKRMAAKTQ